MVESVQEVQYYSHLEKVLKQTQLSKAEKFLEAGCIVYSAEKRLFLCLPLKLANGKFYNTRTYTLSRLSPPAEYSTPEGEVRKVSFECNCQGAQKQKREKGIPFCSHLLALHLFFDRRNKERGWGRWAST